MKRHGERADGESAADRPQRENDQARGRRRQPRVCCMDGTASGWDRGRRETRRWRRTQSVRRSDGDGCTGWSNHARRRRDGEVGESSGGLIELRPAKVEDGRGWSSGEASGYVSPDSAGVDRARKKGGEREGERSNERRRKGYNERKREKDET